MKFVLAPLADFTDAAFRTLCSEGGADVVYTEMVSAAALVHAHVPTRRLTAVMPGEAPVVCQLFGSDEAEIAAAVRGIEKIRDRFAALDLNAGCPMPRIMQTGAGAALVSDPKKIHALLVAMKENTSLPVTLKTRLGPHKDTPTIFETLDAAESAGAVAIAIHARSAGQKHGGPVNLDLLAEAVARSRIPVAGNGSIRTAEDAKAMAATGVAALMIGRAALADPWIFAKLKAALAGEPPPPTPDLQSVCARHLELLLEFRRRLADEIPPEHLPCEDAFAAAKMRTHLLRYFHGFPDAASFRARAARVATLADARAMIAELPARCPGAV